jgi:hypothetical protein
VYEPRVPRGIDAHSDLVLTLLRENLSRPEEVHYRVLKGRVREGDADLLWYAQADAEATLALFKGAEPPEPLPWWERLVGEDLV